MKRALIIILSLIIVATAIVLVWVVSRGQTSSTENQTSSTEVKKYTTADVARHDQKDDCWAIINDSVYNLTSYINRHPGGDEILRACGTDATSLFSNRQTKDGQIVGSGSPHSQAAKEQLDKLKIGTL